MVAKQRWAMPQNSVNLSPSDKFIEQVPTTQMHLLLHKIKWQKSNLILRSRQKAQKKRYSKSRKTIRKYHWRYRWKFALIATMRHNIKKAREDGNILQIPLNCKDICVLQDKRKLIKSGELFSLVDNAERYPERMFIFTSEISIRFFIRVRTLFLWRNL